LSFAISPALMLPTSMVRGGAEGVFAVGAVTGRFAMGAGMRRSLAANNCQLQVDQMKNSPTYFTLPSGEGQGEG
jgi:hypothetical protein